MIIESFRKQPWGGFMFSRLSILIVGLVLLSSTANANKAIKNIIDDAPISSEEITTTQSSDSNFILSITTQKRKRRREGHAPCEISFPKEKDGRGQFCNNSYGIMYDGAIVNNNCYYQIDRAYEVMDNLRVCNQSAPYQVGRCTLIRPNQRDNIERFCDNTYSFIYKGHIVNNTCYANIERATSEMESTNACFSRPRYGSCRITMPEQEDANKSYCNNSYGIMFRNHIVNNTCHNNLDFALSKMKSFRFCKRRRRRN